MSRDGKGSQVDAAALTTRFRVAAAARLLATATAAAIGSFGRRALHDLHEGVVVAVVVVELVEHGLLLILIYNIFNATGLAVSQLAVEHVVLALLLLLLIVVGREAVQVLHVDQVVVLADVVLAVESAYHAVVASDQVRVVLAQRVVTATGAAATVVRRLLVIGGRVRRWCR